MRATRWDVVVAVGTPAVFVGVVTGMILRSQPSVPVAAPCDCSVIERKAEQLSDDRDQCARDLIDRTAERDRCWDNLNKPCPH